MVRGECGDSAPDRQHGRHARLHLRAPRHQLVAQVEHLRRVHGASEMSGTSDRKRLDHDDYDQRGCSSPPKKKYTSIWWQPCE